VSNSKIVEALKHDQKLNIALNDFYNGHVGKGIIYTHIAQFIKDLLSKGREG
jgi:hypothetical protein